MIDSRSIIGGGYILFLDPCHFFPMSSYIVGSNIENSFSSLPVRYTIDDYTISILLVMNIQRPKSGFSQSKILEVFIMVFFFFFFKKKVYTIISVVSASSVRGVIFQNKWFWYKLMN